MIGRTLSKRVQKLEARLIPTDEPMIIHIVYVSPDGSVEDGYTIGGPSKDASAPRRHQRAAVATDISKYTGQYSSTMASERIESSIFLFSFDIGHSPAVQSLV